MVAVDVLGDGCVFLEDRTGRAVQMDRGDGEGEEEGDMVGVGEGNTGDSLVLTKTGYTVCTFYGCGVLRSAERRR